MTAPLRVTILGAGRLGTALAAMLSPQPEFLVQVVDPSEDALHRLSLNELPVTARFLRHHDDLPSMLAGSQVAVAAVPEAVRGQVAAAALKVGTHYLDFAPATGVLREHFAELGRTHTVLSGCGVSPGLIDNVVYNLLRDFGAAGDLTVRVGSIPRFPVNRLGYGQIWNVDGLIDEYTKPSAAIRDGQPVALEPLGDYERVIIDGIPYEGFTTAGGLEDLDWLAAAGLRNVTFKTLRYPGHLDYIRFLLDDLALRSRRDVLRNLLLNGLPLIENDVLLLAVTARGIRDGQIVEKTVHHRFTPNAATGPFNALTSAAAGYAATLLLLLARGKLAPAGFTQHRKIEAASLFSERFLGALQSS